jgi:hypothetical protein
MFRMRHALLTIGLGFATTAIAHHSFASFEMTKVVTLQGTVHAWEWTNPHTWLWLVVTDEKGGVVTWGIEGTSPGELVREGWSHQSVQVGDKVTVEVHPLKDGRNGGSMMKVTFADGHSLGHNLGGAPAAAAPPSSPTPSSQP